jgi:hypothetical protein
MKNLSQLYPHTSEIAYLNSRISQPLVNPNHVKQLGASSTDLRHRLLQSWTVSHTTTLHPTTLPPAHQERGYSVPSATTTLPSHSHTITINKLETFSPPPHDPHSPKRSNKNRTNVSSFSKELYANQERMKRFNGN